MNQFPETTAAMRRLKLLLGECNVTFIETIVVSFIVATLTIAFWRGVGAMINAAVG